MAVQSKIEDVFGKIPAPSELKPYVDRGGAGGLSLFLSNLIKLIYAVAAIILVFMLVWGAYEWILSGGDKEKISNARRRIVHALIGLMLFAIAVAFMEALGHFTGFTFFGELPAHSYPTPYAYPTPAYSTPAVPPPTPVPTSLPTIAPTIVPTQPPPPTPAPTPEPTPCPTWYQDQDNDTFGNPAISQISCTQPSGFMTNNTDCHDGNASVNPGQTLYFTTPYITISGGSSYDYNCNGQAELNPTWPNCTTTLPNNPFCSPLQPAGNEGLVPPSTIACGNLTTRRMCINWPTNACSPSGFNNIASCGPCLTSAGSFWSTQEYAPTIGCR